MIQSMTTASQKRLDKFYNSLQMRLAKFYNLTMSKIDLGTGSDVRSACKLVKFLTEINKKMHDPKTYNEAINNLI